MIREATPNDLYRLVEMCASYYPHTYYYTISPFNTDAVSVLVLSVIEEGIMLVAEDEGVIVGMFGLVLAPYPFDPELVGAYQLIWWLEPEHHGKGLGKDLIFGVEPIAKARGVSYIHMACMANSPIQAAALYIKAGYDHTEMSFTKRI